jgi:hypothetical protein
MELPIAAKALLYVAQPMLISIFKDMVSKNINSENLAEIKQKLYTFVAGVTGKTAFTWDDDIAKIILDTLTNKELYQKYGDELLDIAEEWVASSETHWDNELLLPVLAQFRISACIPDGEK